MSFAALSLTRRELMARFDQRSLRERVLLAAAGLSLLAVAWDSLLMAPLARQQALREREVEQLTAEVSGLETSLRELQQAPAEQDQAAQAALSVLRAEVAALDARLASATSGLIAPKEMGRVLERVLAHSARLKLRALRSLPPEPLLPPASPAGAGAQSQAAGPPVPQIYKHGLELELAGGWLDTLKFVQELEALPWRFFWDRIEYQVEQHPQGIVRVRLFTLGMHEGWIGV